MCKAGAAGPKPRRASNRVVESFRASLLPQRHHPLSYLLIPPLPPQSISVVLVRRWVRALDTQQAAQPVVSEIVAGRSTLPDDSFRLRPSHRWRGPTIHSHPSPILASDLAATLGDKVDRRPLPERDVASRVSIPMGQPIKKRTFPFLRTVSRKGPEATTGLPPHRVPKSQSIRSRTAVPTHLLLHPWRFLQQNTSPAVSGVNSYNPVRPGLIWES